MGLVQLSEWEIHAMHPRGKRRFAATTAIGEHSHQRPLLPLGKPRIAAETSVAFGILAGLRCVEFLKHFSLERPCCG